MTIADLVDHRTERGLDTPLSKCEHMVGCKTSFFDGQRLYVSPAMASLLMDDDSIEMVAKAVKVVVIPNYATFTKLALPF